jgi:hypothetical protein
MITRRAIGKTGGMASVNKAKEGKKGLQTCNNFIVRNLDRARSSSSFRVLKMQQKKIPLLASFAAV